MPTDRTPRAIGGVTGVRLREIEPRDTPAVRELVLAGLAEHWGSVDQTLNRDLDDLAVAHPGSYTLVAEDPDGSIVGTGTLAPRSEHDVEVLRMSVATHLRGAGLGRRILDELVAVAFRWGARSVVLETTASWTATVAFYEHCGFQITHYAEGPFGPDAWFERRLEGLTGAPPVGRSGDGGASM